MRKKRRHRFSCTKRYRHDLQRAKTQRELRWRESRFFPVRFVGPAVGSRRPARHRGLAVHIAAAIARRRMAAGASPAQLRCSCCLWWLMVLLAGLICWEIAMDKGESGAQEDGKGSADAHCWPAARATPPVRSPVARRCLAVRASLESREPRRPPQPALAHGERCRSHAPPKRGWNLAIEIHGEIEGHLGWFSAQSIQKSCSLYSWSI